MKNKNFINILAVCALCLFSTTACQSDVSNKTERNAIKSGNKLFEKNKFKEAIKEYDEALDANSSSEVAKYDRALASVMTNDSIGVTDGMKAFDELGKAAQTPDLQRASLYNLGNVYSLTGDNYRDAAKAPENQQLADTLNQISTQYYRQAIEYYKQILRRQPNDIKTLQNLRITQLKLPPEDQNKNNNDKNKDQQQQQNQDQQQQQQNQDQQQQPQSNQDKDQMLNAVQNRENQTRREQGKKKPVQAVGRPQSDKPW
jgi:tetratricopeptide (TPR) repeat protein